MGLVSKMNGVLPSSQVSTYLSSNPTSVSKKRASTVGGLFGQLEYTTSAQSETGRCIWADSSGNIYVGNYEGRLGSASVSKLNSSGVLQWTRTINKNNNQGYVYMLTGDSTYIYAFAIIQNSSSKSEPYIIRMAQSDGVESSSKRLENVNSVTYDQEPYAMSIRPDGTFVVFTSVSINNPPTDKRASVVAISSGLSSISWQTSTFRSSYAVTTQGGVTGGSANFSWQWGTLPWTSPSRFIQKLTSAGSVDWTYLIDKLGTEPIDGVADSSDNLYLACTLTGSPLYGGYDIGLVKINSSGTVTAAKAIGRSGVTQYEQAYGYGKCIVWDDSKTYLYVLGYAAPSAGSQDSADWWLGKFDTSLNLQWQRFIAGGSYTDSYDLGLGLFVRGNWIYIDGYQQDSNGQNMNVFAKLPTNGGGAGNTTFTLSNGTIMTLREADLSIGDQTGVVTSSAGALYSTTTSGTTSLTTAGANVDAVASGYTTYTAEV